MNDADLLHDKGAGAADLDFARLVDAMPAPCLVFDADFHIAYVNEAYERMVSRPCDSLVGRYVFDAFPETPERIAEFEATLHAVLDGESTLAEDQVFAIDLPDGRRETRVWDIRQYPYPSADGPVTHIVQFAKDVTTQHQLNERAGAMSNELDHRTRNLLALIMAMVDLSEPPRGSAADYQETLQGRIAAMAATHAALAENNWRGLLLRDVLASALKRYASRTTLSGPELHLSVKSSQDASLLFHELTRSAAATGCFAAPKGRLHVSWTVDAAAGELAVTWRETGCDRAGDPNAPTFYDGLTVSMPRVKVTRTSLEDGVEVTIRAPSDLSLQAAHHS